MADPQFLMGRELIESEGFPSILRLRNEYYECLEEPDVAIQQLLRSPVRADLFTFTMGLIETGKPDLNLHTEWDQVAVLSLTSYEHWWKKQINDKTRNMVRKAGKAGVEIKVVDFSDELVRGIENLYNESPIRQGRRFRHFGKKFAQIKEEHSSFLDRSEFIGAFFQGQLIGFVKLVHGRGVSNLMNIISLISQRDKAPTNALLAKAVEICCQKGVASLHYGTWSRRTMGDFKKHHDFHLVRVPRYYVPLTLKGNIALKLKLHVPLEDRLPEKWVDKLAEIRLKWNMRKFRGAPAPGVNLRKAIGDSDASPSTAMGHN